MKKVLACCLALILFCCSFAVADEGCYVPSYKAFMDSFVSKVALIDEELSRSIIEKCFIDGEWIAPDLRVTSWYSRTGIYFDFSEGYGFLDDIDIEISKDNFKDNEDAFKQIIFAAATSIIADADEAFEQSFFDNIYYEYTKASPAGYIVMSWHCGVYCFSLTKSSSDITFTIDLSVYEAKP